MKDCDGNPLKINDRVAVQNTAYKTLTIGTVVGFAPQTVRVRVQKTDRHWRNVEPRRLAKVFNQDKEIPEWKTKAKQFIKDGFFIKAIKHCRECTGMSLIDARDACNEIKVSIS